MLNKTTIIKQECLGNNNDKNNDFRLYLCREEIDNPHKKEGKKFYSEEFAVEVLFQDPEKEL
jgi:hypothetical protein